MNRRRIGAVALFAAVAATALLFGCRPERKPARVGPEGKEYGVTQGTFRHRWWNYEERGRSYLDGQFYEDAIGDFKNALERRSADTPRARTYGMHFVRYYPNREIGIAYMHTGQYELAMKHLNLSLAQAPTAKAKFYLHKTYKGYLAQKKDIDKEAPIIALQDAPKNGAASLRYPLKGEVTDDYFVDTVEINEEPLDIPKAQKQVAVDRIVDLTEETNSFAVAANDLAGKRKVEVIRITQDITGPMLSVKQPRLGATVRDKTIAIKGLVVDPAGVAELKIAGKPVAIDRTKNMSPFAIEVPLEEGRNLVRFRATDQAGNVTVGRLPFRYTASDAVAYLPALDEEDEGIFWETKSAGAVFGPPEGAPEVEVLNLRSGQIVPLYPKDVDKTNGGSYVLQVAANSETVIEAITVNGRGVEVPQMPNVFFTQRVPMDVGDVTVKVTAKDKDGRDGDLELKVKTEVPKTFDTENRLALAPLPLRNQLEDKAAIKTMAFDGNLLSAFHRLGRFRLVDRSEEAVQKFLDEQRLAQSSFIDTATAIQTGKLLNAEYLLFGAIVEDENGAEVLGRLVHTETGEIVATPQVYGLGKNLAGMKKLAGEMAEQVVQELPLISGTVKVKGDKIAIDKGENANLKRQFEVIVFRPDPDWGDEAPPEEIAIAEIERVGKSLSFVQTLKMIKEDDAIKNGDEFVTR